MNLPPFPDEYIPTSPEVRLRLLQWGEECARMAVEDARLAGKLKDTPYGPGIFATDLLDAERYHWLRGHAGEIHAANNLCWEAETDIFYSPKDAASLDAAIDAARTDEGRGE